MSDDVKPILCGKCNVTPELGFEREGEMWASCPVCGQEDRIADIQREAAEHSFDKMVRQTLSGIGNAGSGITVDNPPERQYRWITGE